MSSKGTKRYTFRLPPDLMARVAGQRDSLRWRSPRPPADLTDVVRRALEDWLAKYRRSAGRRRKPGGRKGAGKGPGASPAADAAACGVYDTPAMRIVPESEVA